ncbi:hypothetical protein [Streptomyces sp. NPDC005009]
MRFFSTEDWQAWRLDGEPLIPLRMPVLSDDDFLSEDEGGPGPAHRRFQNGLRLRSRKIML